MRFSAELEREIERGKAIRRLLKRTMATSAGLRSELCALQPRNFLLLAVAEALIAAHKTALAEGDGATIDIIQDALVHVGKRLVREFNADGRSARTILGHYGQEPRGGFDRAEPLPE